MSLVTMDGTELKKRIAMRLHADRASVVGHAETQVEPRAGHLHT